MTGPERVTDHDCTDRCGRRAVCEMERRTMVELGDERDVLIPVLRRLVETLRRVPSEDGERHYDVVLTPLHVAVLEHVVFYEGDEIDAAAPAECQQAMAEHMTPTGVRPWMG